MKLTRTSLICSLIATLLTVAAPASAQNGLEIRKAAPGVIAKAARPAEERAQKALSKTESAQDTQGQESKSSGGNYRLRANDLVEVRVYQEDDISGKVRVREDGTVRLPLVPETIKIGGLSLTEAENRIRAILADGYIRSPRVTVNISEYSKTSVTVMGEVARPGTYAIANNKSITLLQAIGLAGSFTRLADRDEVILKRVVNGKEQIYKVDAEKMAQNAVASIYVQDGDTIIVEKSAW